MSEATVNDIPAIVDDEATRRAEEVARSAAAQIDQANSDAQAIARAAQQTELGSHIQRVESEGATWRAAMEMRLTETAAAAEARAEELKALILANASPPPPPPILEAPPVEGASVSGEPEPNLKQPDTTPEPKPRRGLFQLRPQRKVL